MGKKIAYVEDDQDMIDLVSIILERYDCRVQGTGDTAPAGTYYCDKCGSAYEHKNDQEPLPRCPVEGIWTVWNTEPLKVRES